MPKLRIVSRHLGQSRAASGEGLVSHCGSGEAQLRSCDSV